MYHFDPRTQEIVHCSGVLLCKIARYQDHYANISEAVRHRNTAAAGEPPASA